MMIEGYQCAIFCETYVLKELKALGNPRAFAFLFTLVWRQGVPLFARYAARRLVVEMEEVAVEVEDKFYAAT